MSAKAGVDRRDMLKLSAATAAAGLAAVLMPPSALAQAGAEAASGQAPAPEGWELHVDIPGCLDASKNIREIAIDELSIDVRATARGRDAEYRLYGPGHAHWGSASFTSAVTLGASKELQTWFNEAAKGKNIRKNITVTLFKSDRSGSRTYVLYDCVPTQWSSLTLSISSTVQTETLRVKLGRVEFKT